MIMQNIDILKEKLENLKCVVFGDMMLDTYLYGDVKRISPEAPIPVVNICRKKSVLGGAANVAANIRAYGVQTLLCGVIGEDTAGETIISELQAKGIDFKGLQVKKRSTTTKTRIVGKAQQIVRFDEEQTNEYTDIEDALWEKLQETLTAADVLIISDYKKGVCTYNLCRRAIALAKEKQIFVIVDPKEKLWDKYQDADVVTPNLKEFSDAADKECMNDEQKIADVGKVLREQYHIASLLVTRSEQGMTLLSDGKTVTYPTAAQDVYDVSGAGDTVVATLAAFLKMDNGLEEAAYIANVAAGIAVGKVGTYAVSFEELIDYFDRESGLSDSKLLNDRSLDIKLDFWRKQGKKIIFTNGCFDILHAGHVSYLQKAKAMGNILIVGLNTDCSVKRLKGDQRPINHEKDRACLLSALSVVDAVVLFDEDTPYHLIQKVQPDILVKGGDYKVEDIVGREFAKEVRVISFLEGYSTTAVIEKMRGLTSV